MIKELVGTLIVIILWIILFPMIILTIVLFTPAFGCLAIVMQIESAKNWIVERFLS